MPILFYSQPFATPIRASYAPEVDIVPLDEKKTAELYTKFCDTQIYDNPLIEPSVWLASGGTFFHDGPIGESWKLYQSRLWKPTPPEPITVKVRFSIRGLLEKWGIL